MKTKTIILLGMAGVAGYLVWKGRAKLQDSEDPDFREGYIAGFLTPGPFTIVAIGTGVFFLL